MTSLELAPSPGRWSGGKAVVVDQAGAVDRLPGSAEVDPYWRLSTAFLLGYRENSPKAYRHDLEAWWSWCSRFDHHPFDAERHHVNAWVRSMEQPSASSKPLASSTIRRRLSAVSKFYKYGISVEVLTHSPVDQVGRPKASEETQSIGLSSPEVRMLLRAAEKRSRLHLALVTLLVYNGLRSDEALGADVAGYTYSSGHRILRITRKGNKAATVTLAPATAAALDDYLDSRAEGRNGPLFISQRTPGVRLPTGRLTTWLLQLHTLQSSPQPIWSRPTRCVTPSSQRQWQQSPPYKTFRTQPVTKTQPRLGATTETASATTTIRPSPSHPGWLERSSTTTRNTTDEPVDL